MVYFQLVRIDSSDFQRQIVNSNWSTNLSCISVKKEDDTFLKPECSTIMNKLVKIGQRKKTRTGPGVEIGSTGRDMSILIEETPTFIGTYRVYAVFGLGVICRDTCDAVEGKW